MTTYELDATRTGTSTNPTKGTPEVELEGNTITRKYIFSSDPWSVSSTSGHRMFKFVSLILTLSYNNPDPENPTCFGVISWNQTNYYTPAGTSPDRYLALIDKDQAALVTLPLGPFTAKCGDVPKQDLRVDFEPKLWDRIISARLIIEGCTWDKC